MHRWKSRCNGRFWVRFLRFRCKIFNIFVFLLVSVNKRQAEDPRMDAAKMARVEDDDMQKLKDRREKKFDEKKKEITADQIRPLSGELSAEAILKLRAKVRATARDRIVDLPENEQAPEPSSEPAPITADTFEIMKRERTWRNRTTVLQSSNKVKIEFERKQKMNISNFVVLEFCQKYSFDIKFDQS